MWAGSTTCCWDNSSSRPVTKCHAHANFVMVFSGFSNRIPSHTEKAQGNIYEHSVIYKMFAYVYYLYDAVKDSVNVKDIKNFDLKNTTDFSSTQTYLILRKWLFATGHILFMKGKVWKYLKMQYLSMKFVEEQVSKQFWGRLWPMKIQRKRNEIYLSKKKKKTVLDWK